MAVPFHKRLLKSDFARSGIAIVLRCVSLSLVATSLAHGQLPNLKKPAPPPPPPQEQITDPLGRGTPRGTIAEFIRAVHRDDLVSAARYMQLTDKQKPNTDALAHDLSDLLDRYFTAPLSNISDLPTGTLEDGLPLDQERVGPLKVGDKKFDVILVRVQRPQTGLVWLISSDTLAQVPAMHGAIQLRWLERIIPEPLASYRFLDISLAQWVGWSISIALPLLFFWLCSLIYAFLLHKLVTDSSRRTVLEFWHGKTRWPFILVLTLIAHIVSVYFLGLPLTIRIPYVQCMLAVMVVAVAWLLKRLATLAMERARVSMKRKGRGSTASLILLAERLFNVMVVVIAIFSILKIAGVDTKTALAGLGIGGVAIAFGAQKTVENLLGGVFLLTDEALAVGDTCCISNRVGTVEDITLRSIRLRTSEQSLLSIPAGALSQANIENFATQSKMPVQTILQLQYSTTVNQLKSILGRTRELLADTPKIEGTTSRVRLVAFGSGAIELEVFAYVLTANNQEFLSIREDLLLRIAEIIESAGSSFATPTQYIYLDRKPDPSKPVLSAASTELHLSQESNEGSAGSVSAAKRAS